MADDWAAFTAAPQTAAAPTVATQAPVAAAPVAAAPADDGWAAFTAPAADATAQTAPVVAASPVATAIPGPGVMGVVSRFLPNQDETAGLVAGKDRALRDVIDRPAGWLAQATDALGITHGQGDQVAATNTADRAAYDTLAAQNPTAETGRLIGQGLITLPVGSALGNVARGVGDAVATGAGRVAPAIETGINGISRFLSGEAGGAGGIASRGLQAGSVVANGALQGATAGALTSGQSDAPVADQALHGAEYGAAFAPVVKGLAAGARGIGSAFKGDVNPEVQRLGVLGRDKYGIVLRADQIGSSPALKIAGATLGQTPGSGMAASNAEQTAQVVRAVGKEIGENVDQITPAVMERAATRIGNSLDNVASQTKVIPASNMKAGLDQVSNDASFLTPDQRGVIQRQIENVKSAIDPAGNITGEQYQSLTKMNSPLGKALRSTDSDVRNAAIEIRGHLDDALEQSLPEGSPVMQRLKDARMQYKNLKTIEPLVIKGVPGELSPMALQGAVNKSFKGRGMREQQPNLAEIADIAHQFNLVPDSGTAGRAAMYGAMAGAGGIGTALMSGDLKQAAYTAAGLGGALAAGRAGGAILRSPAYANKLLETASNPNYPGASVMNQLTPYAAPVAAITQGRVRNALTSP